MPVTACTTSAREPVGPRSSSTRVRPIRAAPGAGCSPRSRASPPFARTTGPDSGEARPAPSGHRTAETQVHDLLALLADAHIPGAYVFVGHSWGGLLARLSAASAPRKTAGVVLVDATTFPSLTPERARRLPRKTNREGIDISATVAESDAVKSLGSVPLVVLGSNEPPLSAAFLRAQDAEAALSTDHVDAIALHSTHYIQVPAPAGQPQVVVAAVSAVLDAARGHRHLPGCRELFQVSAVRCRD